MQLQIRSARIDSQGLDDRRLPFAAPQVHASLLSGRLEPDDQVGGGGFDPRSGHTGEGAVRGSTVSLRSFASAISQARRTISSCLGSYR